MIWAKTDLITTIDHHTSNRKELLSNSKCKNRTPTTKPGQEKDKLKGIYHKNNLSFPFLK